MLITGNLTKAQQISQWVSGLGEQLKQATNVHTATWQFDRDELHTCLTANVFWVTEYQLTEKDSGYVVLRLSGTSDYNCRVRLLSAGRQLPYVHLFDEDDQTKPPFEPIEQTKQNQEYRAKGRLRLRVEWTKM